MPFCRQKFTCFPQIWRKKNRKTVPEYGHNSWSRNRCWAYNIPNRSSFWPLQIRRGERRQRNFFGKNSLVFLRFGGKKIEKLCLNTTITLDPEIVVGPITYQIDAPIKLYKSGGAKPNNPIFYAKIHLFSSVLEENKSENCDWIRP